MGPFIQRDPTLLGRNDPDGLKTEEDQRLGMVFACCHPLIPQETQIILALKTLFGFSRAEIARAFLTTEKTIAKRLTQARQKIREARIRFEIPVGDELSQRLNGVLQTLYLLFNEGYNASCGERLIREELCHEAIRLTTLLVEHAASNQPRTHALLALMLLTAARFPARVDLAGNLLRLKDQDRSIWDKLMITRGMIHLAQSAAGDEVSEYHLQAGIAACHCTAENYEFTDWPRILSLYDRLAEIDDSPVVALNRAVAIGNVHGPRAGIQAIEEMKNGKALSNYYLLYAVLAEFEFQQHKFQEAARHFRRSLTMAEVPSEKVFLSKRLRDCEGQLR